MPHRSRTGPPTEGFRVEIVVEGIIDERWRHRFADLDFGYVERAQGTQTVMSGTVEDQAQLHAVLHAVRDLGLVLVSVQRKDD
jgi:hypothetical protein